MYTLMKMYLYIGFWLSIAIKSVLSEIDVKLMFIFYIFVAAYQSLRNPYELTTQCNALWDCLHWRKHNCQKQSIMQHNVAVCLLEQSKIAVQESH